MKKTKGSAVGSVAVALSVLTLLVAVTVQTGLYHLHFCAENELRDHARDLAESAVQLALKELCSTPSFGKLHDASAQILVPVVGYPRRSFGGLTFNQGVAAGWECRFSTNNLEGLGSSPGDRCTLPRRSVHMVGLGKCGDVQVQIETMMERPPFPVGCVSKGPIDLAGATLWGLPPGVPFRPNQPATQQLPAHIFSNKTGANALHLRVGCRITGNAGAVGQVVCDTGAQVEGEIQSGSARQDVPSINVTQVVTRLGDVGGLVPFVEGVPIQSYCVVNNTLDVLGDVELDGGALAVRGNLRVRGTVKGRGSVFCTGNVQVDRGSDLITTRQCAIACLGNLTFGGTATRYLFQGLLYARGEIDAHDLTLVGTLVGDGTTGNERVRLNNVRLVQTPVSIQGGMGLPITFDLNSTDSFACSLRAEPDPTDPNGTRMLFYGEAIYSEDTLRGTPMWPRTDRLWYRAWSSPNVLIKEGRGTGNTSPPNWTSQSTQPYDGSRAAMVAQLSAMLSVNGHQGATMGQINSYLNALEQGTTNIDVVNLNLNNLLAPVDQSRVLYWREGAPNS